MAPKTCMEDFQIIGQKVRRSFRCLHKEYPRTRQWYLSPDIDFRKIKTKSPFLKTVFSVLNIFKIPAPALEYNTTGRWRWHWLFL